MALYVSVITAYFVFFALEWLRPAKRQSVRGFLDNLKYSVIFFAVGPLFAVVPAVLANRLAESVGPLVRLDLSAYWPLAIVPVFITDFFYYWFHRLQHTRLLWWEHKLHHSDRHVCAATAYRHHFLEDALKTVLLVLPMSLVFKITATESALLAFVAQQWGFLIHSNLRAQFGPLGYFLVGPQSHRIHHSDEPEHRDKNFAAFFPVIDILFGTYCPPKRGEFPDTGLSAEH